MRHMTFLLPIALTIISSSGLAPIAMAGCSANFQFRFTDAQGAIMGNVPTDFPFYDTAHVVVPTGQLFMAAATFSSCLGWGGQLWKDNVLIQEWNGGSVTWTTNDPGLYRWYVYGLGNMDMSTTFFIDLTTETATTIGPEPSTHGFIVRSLAVAHEAGYAYLDCSSSLKTDLCVRLLSSEGRLQRTTFHRIVPGENRVTIYLPSSSLSMLLIRITTTEGFAYTGKTVW